LKKKKGKSKNFGNSYFFFDELDGKSKRKSTD